MNNVNPVTESEMQDWFRRLSTMIVSASNQSAEIKRLQEDFAVANSRLSELATDNSKLKAEVADTWRLMQDVEKERDAAKQQVSVCESEVVQVRETLQRTIQDYDNRLQAAHDAMAARDQRIAQLEADLQMSRNQVAGLDQSNADLTRKVEAAYANVRHWTGRANKAETERDNCHSTLAEQSGTISTLSDKLMAVQAKLGEFRSLFEPKEEIQF